MEAVEALKRIYQLEGEICSLCQHLVHILLGTALDLSGAGLGMPVVRLGNVQVYALIQCLRAVRSTGADWLRMPLLDWPCILQLHNLSRSMCCYQLRRFIGVMVRRSA